MCILCAFKKFRYSQETLETYNALACMGVSDTRIFEITQPGCRLEKHIPDTFGGKRHLDLQSIFS